MASSLLFISLFITFAILPHVSNSTPQKTIFFPLTHTLSTARFNSTQHLLKTTATNSATRHNHRRRQISLPLSPGSDYTLSLSLASQPISLYMDTGSDLVWFPCSPFECILCESKPPTTTTFNLSVTTSAPVPCKSPSCAAVHGGAAPSDLCASAKCPLESIEISDCASHACPRFYYAYGDGSLIGKLYTDELSIPDSVPSLKVQNFTFACAHTTLAEPIGVAGFGRGLLSLPAQLATFSPQLGNQFSYCLVSHSFDSTRVHNPSPLILGRYTVEEFVEFVYTPMLDNPKHPYFYSVGLEAVSVGTRRIPAPEPLRRVDRNGSGGVVVDSGTTFTMLPAKFYDSVVTELDRRVGKVYERATQTEDRTGLGPCYYIVNSGKGKYLNFNVPALGLHFVGNSSVVLPRRNYFYEFMDGGDGTEKGQRVGCLMLMNGGDEVESDGGPAATLGNYQQQGFEVVYDLEKRRVGFARRKCSSLWDMLSQR